MTSWHRAILFLLCARHNAAFRPTTRPSPFQPFPLRQSTVTSNDLEAPIRAVFGNDCDILTFALEPPYRHPLGCTIEESLASAPDKDAAGAHVFCTKLVETGNAARAGLKVGDVVVGVNSLFPSETDLQDDNNEDATTSTAAPMDLVLGLGIDKVRALVTAVSRDEPLHLLICRGTTVLEQHERALVDLCQNGDTDTEECVTDYLKAVYAPIENSRTATADATEEEECEPDDSDCLLDEMYNLWAEDLPSPIVSQEQAAAAAAAAAATEQAKPKPWSSRSSPSGTWVRDPKTGKMTNIDA